MLHIGLGLGSTGSGYHVTAGGAARLALVLQNFVWRLENLTPTSTIEQRRLFRHVDLKRKDEETLTDRRFTVLWMGADEDHLIDDEFVSDSESERPAMHTIQLEVYYQAKREWQELQELITRDRHDITKSLRNPDNYAGYSDSFSSTDIGLWQRHRVSGELETGDVIWTLRQEWRCDINETEV